MRTRTLIVLLALDAAACSPAGDGAPATARDTLVISQAASLVRPMRALLDTFSRRTGAVIQEEHGGSLELARRLRDLEHPVDVIALADHEVFPQLLVPQVTSWYARFARNRMVVAYTDRSRAANEISAENWWRVLQRADVKVGRTDPVIAPAGYRTLLLFRLAERVVGEPGLAARLEASTPPRLMRGNAAELAVLLESGELDYIVEYESLARAHRFRYLRLPPEIDLGDPAQASAYARESVTVRRLRDSTTIAGAPILYGASVPRNAPHPATATRFLAYLLSAEGRALLRTGNVDAIASPELVGDSIPAQIRATVTP